MAQEIPANQTIYVNNLNEKVKIDQLKAGLNAIFSQFGEIHEIVARKTLATRGQAFVVFKNITSAVTAVRSMNGFLFNDKRMRCDFAKTDSDVIAKINGRFVERPKKVPVNIKQVKKGVKGSAKQKSQTAKTSNEKGQPVQKPIQTPNQPHNILFITGLTEDIGAKALESLFSRYPGFKEVRMAPIPCIAFVEYIDEVTASLAKRDLNGFDLAPGTAMKVAYANKD